MMGSTVQGCFLFFVFVFFFNDEELKMPPNKGAPDKHMPNPIKYWIDIFILRLGAMIFKF